MYTITYETGDIKPGLPPFSLPSFSINRTDDVTNSTVYLNFPEICSELGAAIGLIPLIAILEQVAIAKAFGIRLYRCLPIKPNNTIALMFLQFV